MGGRGDAYDNAVAESFFATLKKELIRWRTWPTRRELIGEVFDYIEPSTTPRAGTPRSATSHPRSSASRFALRYRDNDHQAEPDLVNPVRRSGSTPECCRLERVLTVRLIPEA
jgi:hypothetical protein